MSLSSQIKDLARKPFHDRLPLLQRACRAEAPLGAKAGGARRDRTDDLMLAKHALYQLSYGPNLKPARLGACHRPVRPRITRSVVGPGRLELPTSRLSGVCSNHLSYRPLKRHVQATHRIQPRHAIAPQPRTAAVSCGKRNEDGDVLLACICL